MKPRSDSLRNGIVFTILVLAQNLEVTCGLKYIEVRSERNAVFHKRSSDLPVRVKREAINEENKDKIAELNKQEPEEIKRNATERETRRFGNDNSNVIQVSVLIHPIVEPPILRENNVNNIAYSNTENHPTSKANYKQDNVQNLQYDIFNKENYRFTKAPTDETNNDMPFHGTPRNILFKYLRQKSQVGPPALRQDIDPEKKEKKTTVAQDVEVKEEDLRPIQGRNLFDYIQEQLDAPTTERAKKHHHLRQKYAVTAPAELFSEVSTQTPQFKAREIVFETAPEIQLDIESPETKFKALSESMQKIIQSIDNMNIKKRNLNDIKRRYEKERKLEYDNELNSTTSEKASETLNQGNFTADSNLKTAEENARELYLKAAENVNEPVLINWDPFGTTTSSLTSENPEGTNQPVDDAAKLVTKLYNFGKQLIDKYKSANYKVSVDLLGQKNSGPEEVYQEGHRRTYRSAPNFAVNSSEALSLQRDIKNQKADKLNKEDTPKLVPELKENVNKTRRIGFNPFGGSFNRLIGGKFTEKYDPVFDENVEETTRQQDNNMPTVYQYIVTRTKKPNWAELRPIVDKPIARGDFKEKVIKWDEEEKEEE